MSERVDRPRVLITGAYGLIGNLVYAHLAAQPAAYAVYGMVERCINAPPSLRFDVFFGQSDNRYNLVDIQHAREVLGYAPQDRAEDHEV